MLWTLNPKLNIWSSAKLVTRNKLIIPGGLFSFLCILNANGFVFIIKSNGSCTNYFWIKQTLFKSSFELMAETIFSYCSSTCFYRMCSFLGLRAKTALPIKVGLVDQYVLTLDEVWSGYNDCLWHQSLLHWHRISRLHLWQQRFPPVQFLFVTSGLFPHNWSLSFPI